MTAFDQLTTATATHRDELLTLPVMRRAIVGQIDRQTYVQFLTQAYHHVRHTVPLLMLTGARLPASREWLRTAMGHYVEEELGHEQWILQDIEACGGDASVVQHTDPALDTELMVSYAYDSVQRLNPVRMLGMVHVLEGTSVAVATTVADALQPALGLPDRAFTYLRSHGALDVAHVNFFADLVNRLDADELTLVIQSARRFFRLYGNIFRALDTGRARREAA